MSESYTLESPDGKQSFTIEAPDSAKRFAPIKNTLKTNAERPPEPSSKLSDIPTGAARGFLEGSKGIVDTGVNAYELLSKLVGQTPSSGPREYMQKSQEGIDQMLPKTDTVLGSLSEGAGQLLPMLATYANPAAKAIGAVPLAAGLGAINAQQGGPGAMVTGAAKDALLMHILGKAQEMGPVSGAVVGGGASAGAAALSGASTNDVIAQGALGAGFSLYHPETVSKMKDTYGQLKAAGADPKSAFSGMVQNLTTDPLIELQKRIAAKEEAVKGMKSDVAVKASNEKEAQLAQLANLTDIDRKALDALKTDTERAHDAELAKLKLQKHETLTNLQSQIDETSRALTESADKVASYIQDKLPEQYRQMTKKYGAVRDATFEKIDEKTPMTQDTAGGVVGDVISSFRNAFGDSNHAAFPKLQKLFEKYGQNPTDTFWENYPEIASFRAKPTALASFMDQNPVIAEEFHAAQAATGAPIPFKDFYRDLKHIHDAIPEDGKASYGRSIIGQKLGEMIGSVDDSFRDLQKEYANFAQLRESTNSVFKPWEGKGELEAGQKFLERFGGKGSTPSPSDQRILKFIESGVNGDKLSMAGLGDVASSKFSETAQRLEHLASQMSDLKSEYGQFGSHIAKLASAHVRDMDTISALSASAAEQTQLKMEQLKASIENAKEQALQALDVKESIFRHQRRRTIAIDEQRNMIERIAGAVSYGIGGFGLWKLGRLVRAGLGVSRASRAKGSFRKS